MLFSSLEVFGRSSSAFKSDRSLSRPKACSFRRFLTRQRIAGRVRLKMLSCSVPPLDFDSSDRNCRIDRILNGMPNSFAPERSETKDLRRRHSVVEAPENLVNSVSAGEREQTS